MSYNDVIHQINDWCHRSRFLDAFVFISVMQIDSTNRLMANQRQ